MTTIIRASSLPGYTDCPRRWAARTLGKEVRANGFGINLYLPLSIGASVGTATHSGAAFTMTEKMKSGSLGNETEAQERALADLDEGIKSGVTWDEATLNANEAQKQVTRMVRVFRHTLAEELQPIAVERRLEAKVGDDFVLSGQSDMQIINPEGIDDLKTGRFPRIHYAQLGSYSLLSRTAYPDINVKNLRTQFIKRVAVKNEQPVPVTEVYDQAVAEQAAVNTIFRLKADVTEFRRRAQEDDAPPEHAFLANPASILCSPKWCPAHGTPFCREHKITITKH